MNHLIQKKDYRIKFANRFKTTLVYFQEGEEFRSIDIVSKYPETNQTLAHHGHRNHMNTINAVFKAGSIANMVKSKKLTKGIMYECVKNKVPFVLAGSIRDDGPLPDVITDMTQAQREYKKILKGASMVIMISTMWVHFYQWLLNN